MPTHKERVKAVALSLVLSVLLVLLSNTHADATPKFERVTLISVSKSPALLVVQNTHGELRALKLAPGVMITAQGKKVKTERLKAGDHLHIATHTEVPNVVISDESLSAAELAVHSLNKKLIQVTTDPERLDKSAKQWLIYLSVVLGTFIVLLLFFIIHVTGDNVIKPEKADEGSPRRRI